MILSFHPAFSGDKYISVAGREINDTDIDAIGRAAAVILPQACPRPLYEAAYKNCARVFPDFSTKFNYPGKVGQVELFRKTNTPHPETQAYQTIHDFYRKNGDNLKSFSFGFPLVFKNNWSDEGHGVFLVDTPETLADLLQKTEAADKNGLTGFLLQRYIETRATVLRVVVIYSRILSYWRIGQNETDFRVSASAGARIDKESYPHLQAKGVAAVRRFCDKTGLNLGGLDLVFPNLAVDNEPLFLEINYYFGRRGLGGSEKFYELLIPEIEKWLQDQGVKKPNKTK